VFVTQNPQNCKGFPVKTDFFFMFHLRQVSLYFGKSDKTIEYTSSRLHVFKNRTGESDTA
jgi:hypothetical protein